MYQVEVDPPSNPELASGAEIIGTAFYHAIGYNVVDVYLAELDRESLVIADTATIRDPLNGRRRRLKKRSRQCLQPRRAPRERPLPGARQPIRAWKAAWQLPLLRATSGRSERSRAHEHRRELRGARIFGAWLNHDDSRGINSLDMLETTNGRGGSSTTCSTSDPSSAAAPSMPSATGRERVHVRAETGVADAGHAWST